MKDSSSLSFLLARVSQAFRSCFRLSSRWTRLDVDLDLARSFATLVPCRREPPRSRRSPRRVSRDRPRELRRAARFSMRAGSPSICSSDLADSLSRPASFATRSSESSASESRLRPRTQSAASCSSSVARRSRSACSSRSSRPRRTFSSARLISAAFADGSALRASSLRVRSVRSLCCFVSSCRSFASSGSLGLERGTLGGQRVPVLLDGMRVGRESLPFRRELLLELAALPLQLALTVAGAALELGARGPAPPLELTLEFGCPAVAFLELGVELALVVGPNPPYGSRDSPRASRARFCVRSSSAACRSISASRARAASSSRALGGARHARRVAPRARRAGRPASRSRPGASSSVCSPSRSSASRCSCCAATSSISARAARRARGRAHFVDVFGGRRLGSFCGLRFDSLAAASRRAARRSRRRRAFFFFCVCFFFFFFYQ